MPIDNLTIDITNTTTVTDIINTTINTTIQTLKPFIAVLGGLIGIYIIYLIYTWLTSFLRNRRIRKTYENTKTILEKLAKIDKKINNLEKNNQNKKNSEKKNPH